MRVLIVMTQPTIPYSEFVAKLVKPGSVIQRELRSSEAHIWHMATGVVGEASELLECLMCPITDLKHVVEELGDIEFYTQSLRDWSGLVFVETNFCEERWHHAGTGSKLCVFPGKPTSVELSMRLVIAAGNLIDAVKRIVVYRVDADFKKYGDFQRSVREKVSAALIDIAILMGHIRANFGFTLTEIIDANRAKLAERYKDLEYSDVKAVTRADKPSLRPVENLATAGG